MSLPAASLTGVVSMATVEEEAPLFGLSGLKLRRDLDSRSGLRSPAATDKGDLEIDVSVAAVPSSIVLQSWTDRRVWTTAVDSPYGGGPQKKDILPTFLDRESKPCLSHRTKATDPNPRPSDGESQFRRRSAAFCSLLQKNVRFS